MASCKFMKGMKYEIANRAFALNAIERISNRVKGRPEYIFWNSYVELEKFNAPKYLKFAKKLGLDPTPSLYTRTRAWSTNLIPIFLFGPTLKLVYVLTKVYLKDLKKIRDLGSLEDMKFLNYMVAQEELQIELMELAIAKKYSEIKSKTSDFINLYANEIKLDN